MVWHDNTAVNYSNWGQHDTGPSMLSQNSCYWIQSSNGVWRLGSCTNVTMGVICKIPRGRDPLLLPKAPGADVGWAGGPGDAGQSSVPLAAPATCFGQFQCRGVVGCWGLQVPIGLCVSQWLGQHLGAG